MCEARQWLSVPVSLTAHLPPRPRKHESPHQAASIGRAIATCEAESKAGSAMHSITEAYATQDR